MPKINLSDYDFDEDDLDAYDDLYDETILDSQSRKAARCSSKQHQEDSVKKPSQKKVSHIPRPSQIIEDPEDTEDDYNALAAQFARNMAQAPSRPPKAAPQPPRAPQNSQQSTAKKFDTAPRQSDPSVTHEIRGIKIDFSRVSSMAQISSVYNDHDTFGIKFTFAPPSQPPANTKTIWFGRSMSERDRVFSQEYRFWRSLSSHH